MGQDEGGGGGFVVCGGVGVGGVGGCGGLVVGECVFTAAGCGQDWRRAENQLHLVAGASSFLVFAQQSSKQMSSLLFVDFLICLVFVDFLICMDKAWKAKTLANIMIIIL